MGPVAEVHTTKETKAQKVERLKRSKNPWEALEEIKAFARAGRASVLPEWANLYFKWWGIYTQGDGAGAIGGQGGEGKATEYFMMRIALPNGIATSEQIELIADIAAKTSEILETTRQQVHRIDEFMDEAASRARVQFDRAEMVLDDAMGRTQRTLAMVERGILKPIVQVQGVAAGLKSAITVLLRGRPNPEEAHSDEEMFI